MILGQCKVSLAVYQAAICRVRHDQTLPDKNLLIGGSQLISCSCWRLYSGGGGVERPAPTRVQRDSPSHILQCKNASIMHFLVDLTRRRGRQV